MPSAISAAIPCLFGGISCSARRESSPRSCPTPSAAMRRRDRPRSAAAPFSRRRRGDPIGQLALRRTRRPCDRAMVSQRSRPGRRVRNSLAGARRASVRHEAIGEARLAASTARRCFHSSAMTGETWKPFARRSRSPARTGSRNADCRTARTARPMPRPRPARSRSPSRAAASPQRRRNARRSHAAGERPDAFRPCSDVPSHRMRTRREPRPLPVGSTTVSAMAAARAASTALPPARACAGPLSPQAAATSRRYCGRAPESGAKHREVRG